jgi:hypothetical protein
LLVENKITGKKKRNLEMRIRKKMRGKRGKREIKNKKRDIQIMRNDLHLFDAGVMFEQSIVQERTDFGSDVPEQTCVNLH